MLTQLDITRVSNIRLFFRRLAITSAQSVGSKPWPNLRILRVSNCYACERFVSSAANPTGTHTSVEEHTSRVVNQLLSMTTQALVHMPCLETLHLGALTPFNSLGILDLTVLRFPKLESDVSPRHLLPFPPNAAILFVCTHISLQRDLLAQWKSTVRSEWSKELFGYHSSSPLLQWKERKAEDSFPEWEKVSLTPWDDEEANINEEEPVLPEGPDSVNSGI